MEEVRVLKIKCSSDLELEIEAQKAAHKIFVS